MSLYIYQNDQQTGPFSEEQIQQMIQRGAITLETLAWKEGMATWVPLSTLRGPAIPVATPPPPPKAASSMLGVISFAWSLISGVLWIVLLAMAGLAHNNGTATQGFNIVVGLFFMGGVALNFGALVIGVIGAFKSRANTLAIVGACLNGFELLSLVGLICLGLAMRGSQ